MGTSLCRCLRSPCCAPNALAPGTGASAGHLSTEADAALVRKGTTRQSDQDAQGQGHFGAPRLAALLRHANHHIASYTWLASPVCSG